MAAGNFGSPMQLLILLAVVLLVFGGKRLRNLGGDLGGAIKGFKNSMASAETEKPVPAEIKPQQLNNDQSQFVASNEAEKNSINRANQP
ncbi:MAG: twin-arginine translocase TatA/TatE family subunit [Gammaproteobacteria bacterium]|nr:MAG: twin-arginine translocase TatA/TatE family subunit [Gammaproteobacteria bacterium]